MIGKSNLTKFGKEIKYDKRCKVLDKTITIRIDSELLEDFRKITGEGYQSKIRDLMVEFVNREKYVYKKEEEKKNRMLRLKS